MFQETTNLKIDHRASGPCLRFTGTMDIQGNPIFTNEAEVLQYLGPGWLRVLAHQVKILSSKQKKSKSPGIKDYLVYFTITHRTSHFDVELIINQQGFTMILFPHGRGLLEQFSQSEQRLIKEERFRIRSLIEEGILNDSVFTLHYQPIIALDDHNAIRAIKGAEAFLRVIDGGRICNPISYLDVAELDPLLMRRLGFKILELACADLKSFKTRYPLFTVSLNVSEKQFNRFDDAISFSRIFTMVKAQYEVERYDIALEVPQVSADQNSEGSTMVKELFEDGTPIILDNFTLGALMKEAAVDIDKYKISGTMVEQACKGTEGEQFVAKDFLRRVFQAARTHGKSVVVKGIEEESQIGVLLGLGFDRSHDLVQGNLFCPPLELQGFEKIYQKNVYRHYRHHVMDLLKKAQIRVLYQNTKMLIDICAHLRHNDLSLDIQVAHSFSELWNTTDRNLVVIMGYDFVSTIVSPDQLKGGDSNPSLWQDLIDEGALFEIPGLPMALINNFEDRDQIAKHFEMVEEYDGHNLYQILITINKEKTEKIPFIILSEKDTELKMVEHNVLILDKLSNLENFQNAFFNSVMDHPEAISKFTRL